MSLKSPTLIIIAVLALWADSVANMFIGFLPYHVPVCALSVLCTTTIHYIGFIAIIYRALRIFEVIKVEDTYLKQLYNINTTLTDS